MLPNMQSLNLAEADDELAAPAIQPGRRTFVGMLFGLGTAAVAAASCVPLIRYIAFPLGAGAGERQWTDLGPLDEFGTSAEPTKKLVSINHMDGWQEAQAQQAVYVTHDAHGSLAVLSAVCPHLGCSVAWKAERMKFVCPCHGGCFAADGERISGPPPRGLTELPMKTDSGRLLVSCQPAAKVATPA